ncbi:aldose 1-epimerase family protein [Croceibacterium sp. LX-88]|uniref:Aldose 1-epimerase family protein n=1 Tax=Croceibacterium selenioxidans TaxID=2838833 RepID=A0ABS5W5W1_9SPHN|nr:aldose 1-epimerase family protein [Croceibacterium selenioxidans]MBT2135137.1 aldose 1-epimerase family protein [Croceibacterium selenioxidans]
MSELVAIASQELSARIDPLGAELWSLTDQQGREYMTDADPAFWSGHAPLLFPIVGALNGGRYRLDGTEYLLPKHGFARVSPFELIQQAGSRALFRLSDNEATRSVYPFNFALEMEFVLEGLTLSMTATVRNSGSALLPFSFGFHPAFAWPLPGGVTKEVHTITFAKDEPQAIRRIDAEGLIARNEASPIKDRQLMLTSELFEDDALIWDELASRRVSYGEPGGTTLDIAFPDTPMLGIWQKPGARYICIEPWAGLADPAGFEGDFRTKPGVMELEPGSARSFRMDVAVRPR